MSRLGQAFPFLYSTGFARVLVRAAAIAAYAAVLSLLFGFFLKDEGRFLVSIYSGQAEQERSGGGALPAAFALVFSDATAKTGAGLLPDREGRDELAKVLGGEMGADVATLQQTDRVAAAKETVGILFEDTERKDRFLRHLDEGNEKEFKKEALKLGREALERTRAQKAQAPEKP
ncbi:MAG: hypothetical protein V1918_07735 [Planctomycetota bacterium]